MLASLTPVREAAGVGLSERDLAILDLERHWPLGTVGTLSKGAAIRRYIGCAPGTYYRQLALIEASPEAMAADPLLIRRLRRGRSERRRAQFLGSGEDRRRTH